MNKNLFQNDHITGNSRMGFDFKGQFKDDENILLKKLKDILNRDVSFSNVDYKLLEPTNTHAVLIQDGSYCEVKTPMYSYFEALFVLPKILDLLKNLKDYKNSYLYFRLGFNESFCDLTQINVMKFVLEFNEDYILKHLVDVTKDGSLERLTDIKPQNLEMCVDTIKKQLDVLKFSDDEDIYGINFNTTNIGYITFKYAQEINYRNKWDELLKCINHTIITLYNTCTVSNFDDAETNKIQAMDKDFQEIVKSFSCFASFKEKYKGIKLSKDLDTDSAQIEFVFPAIKDKLFDLVIKNGIKEAEVNYDSDISRLQLKNLELKKCYHLSGVDIVDSELENCSIKDCDIYDTKIDKSSVNDCNLFGYANCKESKFKNCWVSQNIKLKDCVVSGNLGKMGGVMDGGSLKNTTVLTATAEIKDNVEKTNVNEIK